MSEQLQIVAWQWRKRQTWFAGQSDEHSFWSEWEALQPPYMDARELAKTDPENYELRAMAEHAPAQSALDELQQRLTVAEVIHANYLAMTDERDELLREVEALRADAAAFKNFHRSLCARFSYAHDEKDWRRDQVSLEEHIARHSHPEVNQVAERNAELMKDLDEACTDQQRWQADYERLERRLDICGVELQRARAVKDRTVEILVAIHALMVPPDMKLDDGRVFRYHDPDPQKLLHWIADRVRTIPDELAAIDTARASTDEGVGK